MSLIGITNVDRLEQFLNASAQQLENISNDNEQSSLHIIKTIDSLAAYEISLLCKSKTVSHKLFTQFRYYYNVQLKTWREKLVLGHNAQQVFLKIGNLFITLSEHVIDTDLNIFEQLLFEKGLIEELCSCLKLVIHHINDPNIVCVGNLIFSLGCFQYNGRTLQNNALQEELLDAITQCLAHPWYQMCLEGEMSTAQKTIFDTCLDYVLYSAEEYRKRCCERISTESIVTFSQWFYEQAVHALALNWSEQIVHIISKLISILTNQIWELDNRIDEAHRNSYKLLAESLLLILSKTSMNWNQNNQNKFDFTTGIFLLNLTDLALDSHLLSIIKQKNISEVCSCMTQNEPPDTQTNACRLLLAALTKTELSSPIDAKKLISVILKSLVSDDETSNHRHHLIVAMTHLQRLFQFETIRNEFIISGGLPRIIQFATFYKRHSFKLRDAALKLICTLTNYRTDVSSNMADIIPEITPGSEKQWILSGWKHHNWNNNTKNEGSSFTVTIPTDNFDPTIAVRALLANNKAIDDELLKRVAQRHRENTTLVWIYKNEDKVRLRNITDHLRAIIHIVRVYSDSESSEAIKFILSNRAEHIFVLIHTSVEKIMVKQIQHATHIAAIVVYDACRTSTKPTTELQHTAIVLYEISLQHSIDLLAITIQSNRNHAFWFYEAKQTISADLSTESASFFWQMLLPRIVTKMPSIGSNDFIALALQWYRNNPLVLCEIERFRKEYCAGAAKYWFFTNGSSFVQRLLQKAFEQVDMQIIWAARFFIIDLMKTIESQPYSAHNIGCITLGELIGAKRIQSLLEHQDTFLMPKGFLIGRTNYEKTINDLRYRPRHRNSVYAVLFEIDLDGNPSGLALNDEYILFPLDVSFRIISIQFDQLLDIYKVQLRMLKASENQEQLWQNHMKLLRETGECTDENILFGTLLADMNRVPAAMEYYFCRMDEYFFDPFLNASRLVQTGRIAFRCNRLDEADEFFTLAITLYETLLSDNDPSFIRLLLDFIAVHAKQTENQQAFCIYERIHLYLTNKQSPALNTLFSWSQGLMCLCQMAASDVQLARQMLERYFEPYKKLEFRCTHPVLIGGLAIDIGDFIYKQGHFHISNDCYAFAFEIGRRNLPLCHPMVMVSLQRHLTNVEKHCENDRWALSIRETQILPLLQQTISDINDDDNKIIADTMRDIGCEYIKYGMHEKASFYLEKCIPIYRQQSPLDETSLNKCQAYIFRRENCSYLTLPNTNQTNYMTDLHFSAWYKYTHLSDPTDAEEQHQLWSTLSLSQDFHRILQILISVLNQLLTNL